MPIEPRTRPGFLVVDISEVEGLGLRPDGRPLLGQQRSEAEHRGGASPVGNDVVGEESCAAIEVTRAHGPLERLRPPVEVMGIRCELTRCGHRFRIDC